MPPRVRRRLSADAVDEMVDPDTRMAIVRARVRDAGSRQLETVYADIRTRSLVLLGRHSTAGGV